MLTPIIAADKPNIVWLFSDDHAYQVIGAYGSRFKDEKLTPPLMGGNLSFL
jgi:arylsulfatase A-like enzyme